MIHDAAVSAVIHGAVVRAVDEFYGATVGAVAQLYGAIIVGCGAYVSYFGAADGYTAIQGSRKGATAPSK